jgi:hypothetical protein
LRKGLSILLAAVLLVVTFSGCGKKKEQEEVQKAREWELSNFAEGVTPAPKPAPLPKDVVIVVPESTKAAFHKVKMGVGNRKTKEISKFDVKIGGTAAVPGTGFTIKIGPYLPHFKVDGKTITTKGDEPDDPAVRATITEGGKVVFDGFIFHHAKTPSFVQGDYVIGLLGASK